MRALATFLVLSLGAGVARADGQDYFGEHANDGSQLKLKRQRSRTPSQKLLIGGLLVGAAAAIGFGAYYHLDSRDAANEVSSNGDLTGETWTAAHQATYDRADVSGTRAIVCYVVGAALLGGVIAAAWHSQPVEEEVLVTRIGVAPVHGGAVVGGAWSW